MPNLKLTPNAVARLRAPVRQADPLFPRRAEGLRRSDIRNVERQDLVGSKEASVLNPKFAVSD
jgi:hypothetical protein